MAGYIRQSTYRDGDIILAADSNDEFDQLVAAFDGNTGHKHDGTADEGPVISLLGDGGLTTPLNKIEVDTLADTIRFFINDTGVATEQFTLINGAIIPTTNNDIDLGSLTNKFKDGYFEGSLTVDGDITLGGNITIGDANTDSVTVNADIDSNFIPNVDDAYDLGSAAQEWRDLYIDGIANIDSLIADTADIDGGTIDGTIIGATTPAAGDFTTLGVSGIVTFGSDLNVTGNLTVDGNTTLGDAATDTVTFTADVDSDIIPAVGSTYSLGDATDYWANAYIDAITTSGNVIVGGTLAVTGNQTNTGDLTVNGNTTLGDAATDTVTFTADVDSNIIPSTNNTYDLGAVGSEWKDLYIDGVAYIDNLTIGTSTGITSVDTDLTAVSALDDTLASAKAIKTYVDAQVTAQDLDLQGDSGGALSVDLDSDTLTIAGGTGITTTGAGTTVTVDIDSTVATLTGTQTLTNKTLTAPVVTGGTVDNAIIGGITPAAITGTTVTATSFVGPLTGNVTGNVTGTVTGTVSSLSNHDTGDLVEGTNLYYTQARFDSAFIAKSTTDLSEGTNLYYTTARANTDFDTRLATKSTTDLTEGTNLYYTSARAVSDINTTVNKSFVDALGVDAATLGGDSKATILAQAQADALALSIALG